MALMLVGCALLSQQASAQEFSADKLKAHPRLFLTQENEAEVFAALKNNKELSELNAILLANCDKLLTVAPCERRVIGKRLLSTSREVLRRAFYLSWAYRFTKNEAYAERAKAEVLNAAKYEDWNPSHFLDVAEMALGIAIAHDWLYDKFSPEERKLLADAVMEKAFEPSMHGGKDVWFLKATNNWNSVCNGGLLNAAVSFHEYFPAEADAMVRRSIDSSKIVMKTYDPEGVYPEGPAYWSYGTGFQVALFAALESAYGTPWRWQSQPSFLASAKFMYFMTGYSGEFFNFADCSRWERLEEIMPWFVKLTKDESLLSGQERFLSEKKLTPNVVNRLLPMIFIYGADLNYENPPASKQEFMSFKGEVPLFAVKTEGRVYLAGKGGKAAVSHGHMDVGSFVFDAKGVRWCEDLGPQSYDQLEKAGVKLWDGKQNSERWTIFRYSNFSHNTLSLKGKIHIANGRAEMLAEFPEGAKRGARFDLSEVLGEPMTLAQRETLLIDGAYAQTADTLQSSEDCEIEWRICTRGKVKILDSKTLEIEKNGKRAVVKAECGAEISAKVFTREKKSFEYEDDDVTMTGFEIRLKANKKVVLTVNIKPL